MKKHYLFILLLCFALNAQEKTLFWEISGNGLTKKSYLYGTMHVNDKVSYHLSDAFFTNLLQADYVANESDPETWKALSDLNFENKFNTKTKFYKEFYKTVATKNEIKTVFTPATNYFNNLLSAIGGETSDYQENTVLDMFIYQTGRKYNKKTIGLEDAEASLIPILKIKEEDAKPKDENIQLLVKLMKNRPFSEVLNEYYREKDVVMLDSIYKLMMSKKAHDALIIIRNENMTNSIDSIAKKGSLFAAVGAAHLSGKKGIIELLRQKGYTVKPILDKFSEAGLMQKKKIEDYFPNPGFINTSTNDGMITMPLTKNVFEEFKDVGAPDFTNGGVINIKRIPLNYYLNKNEKFYNKKSLDSLFFENIPGTILEKKAFDNDKIYGYDIKNITKTANNQRYVFYITPLELISISMTGVGDYVRQYENELFNTIKFKDVTGSWETFVPSKNGFSVEIPSFYSCYGNNKSKENIEIQAFDNKTNAYYFVTERTNNSTAELEDSGFEQNQIQFEFYLQHDAEIINSNYDKTTNSLETNSKIGDKDIRLKTIINGNKYYLLGAINAPDADTERFYSSFKTTLFLYKEVATVYNDTLSKYTVQLPKKHNRRLFLDLDETSKKDKYVFDAVTNYTTFDSENNSQVELLYNKFAKYESVATIDSLRVNFRKYFLKEQKNDNEREPPLTLNHRSIGPSKWDDYIKKEVDRYEMLQETFEYNKEKNIYILNNIVSREKSTQAIKYKTVFINDTYYMLSALVHRNYQNNDAFIEKTFNSLTPYGENLEHSYSVFDDKIELFIADAKSDNDSIRKAAMNSVSDLDIYKKNLPVIKSFIDTFEFKDGETEVIKSLMRQIGKIDDESVIPFLENLYKKEEVKTAIQLAIIQSLTNQKSKKGYEKIAELLEYDLPISDNEYDIQQLFNDFEDDLQHSKVLFPKIFQFYSVKEYNEPIISFCSALVDQNFVEANKIKSFKKMILTNAKLELKRVASWKEKNKPDEEITVSVDEYDYDDYDYSSNSPNTNSLKNYICLLYQFKNDKAINDYFAKVKKLNLPDIALEFTRLGISNNRSSSEEIQIALTDEQNRFAIVNYLINKDKASSIKLSDDEIAKSALVYLKDLTVKDTIQFIEKRIVTHAGKPTVYYFYNKERKATSYDIAKNVIYTIAFVLEGEKINPMAYKLFNDEVYEDDEMEKTIALIVQKSLNEEHEHASFEKEKAFDSLNYYDN